MNNRNPINSVTPDKNCQLCPGTPFLYAHAYIPFQFMTCIYPPMESLNRGTVFPELDRPYGVDPEYTVDQ